MLFLHWLSELQQLKYSYSFCAFLCIFVHFRILLRTYAHRIARKFVWASIDVTYTGDSTVNGFCWPGWIWSCKDPKWLGCCTLWWASVFVLKLRWVLEPFLSYCCLKKVVTNKDEKWHLLSHTFAFSCLLRDFWSLIWVLLITKALKEEAWALK